MKNQRNSFLIIAAALNTVAALAHLACIYFGAPLFRFLGTEAMAQMYEAGNLAHPIAACLILATMLLVWAAYTLSGAGLIRQLPLLRIALITITSIYLARAFCFPFIKPYFPENSELFWYTSSSIVLLIGIFHLLGLKKAWARL